MPLGWACTLWSVSSEWRPRCTWTQPNRVLTCRSEKPIGGGPERSWRRYHRRRIVLNVGARWETKRWPPEHFAEIGRRAAHEFGAGLIAVGSAGDRPLVDQLIRRLGAIPVLDLCGQTRLMQLAALCTESDLVISNDTGPLHLAAAAGARVRRDLHLHEPRTYRSFRTASRNRSELCLVRTQLHQKMPPSGVHGRADTKPRVADREGPVRAADHAGTSGLRNGNINRHSQDRLGSVTRDSRPVRCLINRC